MREKRMCRINHVAYIFLCSCFVMFALIFMYNVAYAGSITINSTEVTLYGMDSWADGYITIPKGKESFQLQVTGAKSVSYKVKSGNCVIVSETGLLSPAYSVIYWLNGWGSSSSTGNPDEKVSYDLRTGTAQVEVTADGQIFNVEVSVSDYAEIYANNEMDQYIKNNITSKMTPYEKCEKIAQYIASLEYSAGHSSAISMIVCGGGDCWGSTDIAIRMAKKIGYNAWSRNGNKDGGAGSGHMNALVADPDGKKYYEIEAGYYQSAPRSYYVKERSSLFSYRSATGGIEIYQYDGESIPDGKLIIPAVIDGKKVVGTDSSIAFKKAELKEVVFSEGIEYIGGLCVGSNEALEKVVIPSTVTKMEGGAFFNNPNLKVFDISNNSFFVYEDGILYTSDMKSLICVLKGNTGYVIPDGVEMIENNAFRFNSFDFVVIPESVKEIKTGAFYQTNVKSVMINGNGLEKIGSYAFCQCYSLGTLRVPDSVTEVGEYFVHGTKGIIGKKGSVVETYAAGDKQTFYDSASYKDSFDDVSVVDPSEDNYGYTCLKNSTNKYSVVKDITSLLIQTPQISAKNQASGVLISWKEVSNCLGYEVFRKENGSAEKKIASLAVDEISYCDTAASSGKTYTYMVRAVNGVAGSVFAEKTIKYVPVNDEGNKKDAKPDMPVISSICNSAKGVSLHWTKINNADSYYIYRKSGNGSWSRIAIVSASYGTAYIDKTAKTGTTYRYTIRACKGITLSDYVKDGRGITFIAPVELKIADNLIPGVRVTWNSVKGAKGYNIYRRTSAKSGWTKVGSVEGNGTLTYTDRTSASGVQYEYTVCGYAGKSVGSYNAVKKILRLASPVLEGAKNEKTGVKVTWNTSVKAEGYYIYRKTGNGGWSRIGQVSGNSAASYLDTSVKSGTTYSYTVRAYAGTTLSSYDKTGKTVKAALK